MNVDRLVPRATNSETFLRKRARFIPEVSGCYALTSFSKVVLYIGLATNLRKRMSEHLDDPEKTAETKFGRAMFFYWFETLDLNLIERTWLNMHIEHEGVLPVLNSIYSPTST